MKIAGYEFAEGAQFQQGAKANAKVIGAHLEKLRKQHKGDLTPQQLLEDAKKKASPIHSFFEWDNTAAAEQYRLSQAQGLIKAVVAIYTQDDRTAVLTSAAVTVADRAGAQVHQMSPAATHEAVLHRALRELVAWRKRYEDLAEMTPVFSVVDLVEKSLVLQEEKAAA